MQKKINSVYGAMVIGEKRKGGEYVGPFLIKLSSIIAIDIRSDNKGEPDENGEYEIQCLFYTFKDSPYIAHMSAFQLQEAINSFIFNPDEHMEKYPAML